MDKVFLYLVLLAVSAFSCQSTRSHRNNNFVWGQSELINNQNGGVVAVVDTASPDGRIQSVILGSALNFRFPMKDNYDTTLSYTLIIPYTKDKRRSCLIKNDLRYFVNQDSISHIRMEVVVRSKLFFKRIRLDVPERKAELDTNNFHTFLCRLPKRPFRSDHSFVKYVFTVKVAKRSSFDDVLIVFDSLDLEPKR